MHRSTLVMAAAVKVAAVMAAAGLALASVTSTSAQTGTGAGAPTATPGFVPGKDQPTPSSTGGAERRDGPAREQPNGQVAPPSAINTGVQVIAPEKKP